MKRIGVIIPAITDHLQNELLDGIFRTASAAGYDVIVLTTATNGLDFHIQNAIMEGEESIYCLLERAELDGILLASQYLVKETVRRRISEMIRKAAVPCIDLGGTELGFPSVSIPQSEAVYALTNHLITKHGCRRLLFLSGPEGNADSEQRLCGFLRSAAEHHCSTEIVRGDFWKTRPAELGEELIQHKRELPDAVICASDVMAVTLCNTLQSGGITVPQDVIVTGFDGHLCAVSNFPSVTTISGAINLLGSIGAAKLIRLSGGECTVPADRKMHILYGASCGCVERMQDYQAAALQVQRQIRKGAEADDMLEMRINADVITRCTGVESLTELTAIVDQSAHTIKRYRSLELCILPDWDSSPEHPNLCTTKPYPPKMFCTISKKAWTDGREVGLFPTSQIAPMLMQPHDPVLLFVLPLHASSQVFGYFALAYEKAADFTISVMLFNLISAIANGLRVLRHKRYAEYLQKQIEEASLYDKMTDMLSKKGLLQYLESQEQAGMQNGIMLVTIAKLSSIPTAESKGNMPDTVVQSELLLANAMRLLSGHNLQTARLDKRTFALVFPLADGETPEHFAEEMMIQLDVLIRRMQEGSASAFLPEPYCICGRCEQPSVVCLDMLRERLTASQPQKTGFFGVPQLKRLRREIYKAPELDWSLGELASRLHISKSYVQKLYKEHFGISYMDDLIEARIGLAKLLLKETDLRISDIAASCGYHNATHFMRQFNDKTGMSPTAFRKKT